MKIGLKAGERLFLNGAVIRVDRKTSIELLNDAVFLLEAHVMQREQATTPLRQIYFLLQSMVMDPASAGMMQDFACAMVGVLRDQTGSAALRAGLDEIEGLIEGGRWFEAMKLVRTHYAHEEAEPFPADVTRCAPKAPRSDSRRGTRSAPQPPIYLEAV